MPKKNTSYWYQVGFEEGYQEGSRLAILEILQFRFGTIAERYKSKIKKLSYDEALRLVGDSLDFERKADIAEWLKNNS